jgi:hypothetical protein
MTTKIIKIILVYWEIFVSLSNNLKLTKMKGILIALFTLVILSMSITSCSTGHSACKGFKAHPDYGRKYR